MISLEKPPLNELKHYGVLGMRWGRRKRTESETSKKLKTNIKNANDNYKKELAKMNRETKGGLLPASSATIKAVKKAQKEIDYAKEDHKSNKILEKFKGVEKSKSQLAMENKYKARGLNDDEATVAAYQHLKTKKMLIGIGATVVVAGAGYAAYKIHDNKIDKIIKSDKLLQHVTSDSSKGVRDAFYSSGNTLDNHKYKGLYGKTMGDDAHVKSIKVLSDMKQASTDNARKTLEEIVKNDKDFANKFSMYIDNNSGSYSQVYAKKFAKAKQSISKGVVDKDVYEVFNAALVDHSPHMQPLTDKFFNKLTDKGYNAIKDINDSKYSGYKSLNPIITFNAGNKVEVVDVVKLAKDEVAKSEKIAYAHILGSELVKQGAIIAGAVVANKSIKSSVKNKSEQQIVDDYKKKHPDTKMSYKEIVRSVERGK